MKYILFKNDTTKKISEMIVIGTYNNLKDVPNIKDTILIFK